MVSFKFSRRLISTSIYVYNFDLLRKLTKMAFYIELSLYLFFMYLRDRSWASEKWDSSIRNQSFTRLFFRLQTWILIYYIHSNGHFIKGSGIGCEFQRWVLRTCFSKLFRKLRIPMTVMFMASGNSISFRFHLFQNNQARLTHFYLEQWYCNYYSGTIPALYELLT